MMRANCQVVPAEMVHVEHLAEHMREADRIEIWTANRLLPAKALAFSIRASTHAWTGLADGEPVCAFGVAPVSIIGGEGSIWMLGTDKLARYAMTFLRANGAYVREMLDTYPVLNNYVHDRNKCSKRWLSWLGFSLAEPEPHGFDGELFRRFEMRRN